MDPIVLMLDEVTSALDPALVGDILDLISSLKRKDRALVVVAHHMAFARNVSNKIVFLFEGCIREHGSPERMLDSPETKELKNFLVALNKTT